VRDLRRRLIALAGLVVIVGAVIAALALMGVIGNQGGGGAGIEDVALLDPPQPAGSATRQVGPEAGKLAPDFVISDFDGTRHRLSDFRGKAVYLNFWATWCIPCQVELPDVETVQQLHKGELVVISINRREPLDRARDFLKNIPRTDGGTGVSFTVNGIDPGDTLYDRYRGLGMPVSVFIDANGVVTRVANGQLRLDDMQQAVAEALAAGRAAGGQAGQDAEPRVTLGVYLLPVTLSGP